MAIAGGNADDERSGFSVVDVPRDVDTPEAVVRYLLGRRLSFRNDEAEAILQQCLYRESLGSTNVGRGVAIPQAIGPDIGPPGVIAGRLAAPIPWPDGESVWRVFLLLAPDQQATLRWLEEISRYLRFDSGATA